MTKNKIDTHGITIDFGKHSGTRWTRIPVQYLRWLSNNLEIRDKNKLLADAEMKRRGAPPSQDYIEISGHAIDRAHQVCMDVFHETRNTKEFIYSWLSRIFREALENGSAPEKERVAYKGIQFVYGIGNNQLTLVTVFRDKPKKAKKRKPKPVTIDPQK